MEKDIMTISQVAEFLQISEMTTYKLVNDNKIPAFKIGRHWRVRKDDLYEFIQKKKTDIWIGNNVGLCKQNSVPEQR